MSKDAKVNVGTPREEPRDVENDPQWLEGRITRLQDKLKLFQERMENADNELKLRQEQLSKLK